MDRKTLGDIDQKQWESIIRNVQILITEKCDNEKFGKFINRRDNIFNLICIGIDEIYPQDINDKKELRKLISEYKVKYSNVLSYENRDLIVKLVENKVDVLSTYSRQTSKLEKIYEILYALKLNNDPLYYEYEHSQHRFTNYGKIVRKIIAMFDESKTNNDFFEFDESILKKNQTNLSNVINYGLRYKIFDNYKEKAFNLMNDYSLFLKEKEEKINNIKRERRLVQEYDKKANIASSGRDLVIKLI